MIQATKPVILKELCQDKSFSWGGVTDVLNEHETQSERPPRPSEAQNGCFMSTALIYYLDGGSHVLTSKIDFINKFGGLNGLSLFCG